MFGMGSLFGGPSIERVMRMRPYGDFLVCVDVSRVLGDVELVSLGSLSKNHHHGVQELYPFPGATDHLYPSSQNR